MSTTPQKVYSDVGEKICRLCGSEKDFDRSTNIFSKVGESKKLLITISELLNISIAKEDGLPSTICRHCEGMLTKFSEFKSSVATIQSHLKSRVTTKRCKVFSPTCEPEKKVRVLNNNRSSARSLSFADDSQGNAAANDPSLGNIPEPTKASDPMGNSSLTAADILSQAGLRNPEVSWFISLYFDCFPCL